MSSIGTRNLYRSNYDAGLLLRGVQPQGNHEVSIAVGALMAGVHKHNAMVAFVGDSRVNTAYQQSTQIKAMADRGPAFWAQVLSNGRVIFPHRLNFSEDGASSRRIIQAGFHAAAANSNADVAVLLAGVNDLVTLTIA